MSVWTLFFRKYNRKNVRIHPNYDQEREVDGPQVKYMQENVHGSYMKSSATPGEDQFKSLGLTPRETRDIGTLTDISPRIDIDSTYLSGDYREHASVATSQWMTGSDIYEKFVVQTPPSSEGDNELRQLESNLSHSSRTSLATTATQDSRYELNSDIQPIIRRQTGLI